VTHYAEHIFLHHVRSIGLVACFGASVVRNAEAQFFMLWWARCGSHRKRARTRYVELVFWHHVQSGGHIACFGAPGVRNVNALFFIPRWVPSGSYKKRAGTRYTELVFLHSVRSGCHIVQSGASGGVKHRRTILHSQVGPVPVPQEERQDMLRRTCVFAFHAIWR
jgi:hypothetical protein